MALLCTHVLFGKCQADGRTCKGMAGASLLANGTDAGKLDDHLGQRAAEQIAKHMLNAAAAACRDVSDV